MILIDLNQVLISGIAVQLRLQKTPALDEDLIRHMVLNIIRSNVKKFKGKYGRVVLCCDNRKYWRKEFFPFYKANRKKKRKESTLDWHAIFNMMTLFREEFKQFLPYHVIDCEGAEADDIIGTLAPRYVATEDVLIISSDGDFPQLQRYNGKFKIEQFNPVTDKYLISNDPLVDLKMKIINGDTGDGIPNILSPGDTFVTNTRQKRMTEQRMDYFLNTPLENWNDEKAKTGFSRNKTLIDLSCIPDEIRDKIINTYDSYKPASKQNILNYFIAKKLKNLMDTIGDF